MATRKSKRWVVPIEATVSGYIVVDATSAEEAIEQGDSLIDDAKFGITEDDGPGIDLAEFDRLVDKGHVFSASALEDAFPYRKPRSKSTTTKKKATTAKKTTSKKSAPKGRARGGSDSSKKETKKVTKKATKKEAKNPDGAKKESKKTSTGRRRGVSAKK